MPHQEGRNVWNLLSRMFNRPLDIPELLLPTRLPVRAILALVRRIQRGLAKPTSVVSEERDPLLWVLDVRVVVSTDMFGKAVNENEQRFGLIGLVRPGVELGSSGAGEPVLFERGGGHGRGVSGSRSKCSRKAGTPPRGTLKWPEVNAERHYFFSTPRIFPEVSASSIGGNMNLTNSWVRRRREAARLRTLRCFELRFILYRLIMRLAKQDTGGLKMEQKESVRIMIVMSKAKE